MYCLNQNCGMENKIEETRVLLGEVLEEGLLAETALKVSQDLDKLVLHCLKCKLSLKSLDILDLSKVQGKHSMFLYYDIKHLSYNLARYINHAKETNEMTLLFMQPDWFEYLKQVKIINEYVQFYPVNEMIKLHKEKGRLELRKMIEGVCEEISSKGFSGVRMIGQPSYAIELTSEEDFLSFEAVLSESFKNLTASALCLYDFYDYTSGGKVINEKVIRDSFETHTNIVNF